MLIVLFIIEHPTNMITELPPTHNKINELLNEAFVALSETPVSTPSQPVKTETVQMSAQELIQAQTAKFEKLKSEKFKK